MIRTRRAALAQSGYRFSLANKREAFAQRSCSINRDIETTPGNQNNERATSCAGASRPERMESEKSFHGLEGSGSHAAGRRRGEGRRPQAEGAKPAIRCRIHLGVEARAAHAGYSSHRARADRASDQEKSRAE